ncbi:nuclease domain-containing protein [Burkholderia ubonensis]|uniref:nuclease domain-containing protein n=1 Tax=Burkholderia ubonensis TaxID=101571 RepID=UPI0009B39A64|nr:nuclease domain-containing protein [Burkholderia ubonensis]
MTLPDWVALVSGGDTRMLWIEEATGRSWQVPPGGVASGFVEGGVYSLRVETPHAFILVDEIPLSRQPGQQTWSWTPGFYAGRVDAEVLDDGGRLIATFGLDVGPSPDKLGQPQFLCMVSEILSTMPALLLGDGAMLSQFNQDGDIASFEVAYARMRRYGKACLGAMRAVCQHPLTQLQQQRRMVQPHQVRRLDVRTIQELSRTRAACPLLGMNQGDPVDLSRVTVPHVEPTFDHAANRTIAVMVDRMLGRVAGLGRQFASTVEQQDERLSLRVSRRLSVLAALDDGLRGIRRSKVFSAVTRPEVSATGLNAISAQPDYARAFQLAWKALNMGVLGDDADDPLPMGPTWQIYERWCFVRVSALLEEIAPEAGWRFAAGGSDRIHSRVHGCLNGDAVTLHLQPTFHAWDQPSARGFRSLSRQREPDLVLTVESSEGRRFMVLDAKYRVTRSYVLDAMQSAHIYQNSLTWHGEHPRGSFLLLPKGGAVDWLSDSAFQDEFAVGAFELAPSNDASALAERLSRFLQG